MPRLPWQLDLFTIINAVVDAFAISLGLYLTISRTKSFLNAKKQHASNNGTPAVQVPSLWSRKRPEIVIFTTITTVLWHTTRLLLVAILSINALRVEHADGKENLSFDDMDATPDPEDRRLSILMRPPAVWAVMTLPVLMVLSRAGIVLLFALPRKQQTLAVVDVAPEPSTPTSPSSPRSSKTSLSRKLSEPTSPMVAQMATPASPRSPMWDFIRTIPSRLYGPNQNLYLIAFYLCIAYAAIVVPFTYHPIWYFDTPRLEPVTTLYLAAVLKDAMNVKGLSNRDKRQRGIPSFQRMVYIRWAALLVMVAGMSVDLGYRLILDGSVLYMLLKVET